MFGEIIATTKEELDKYYTENHYVDVESEDFKNSREYEKYEKALKAIENGLTIYSGWIDFECCEYNYAEIFQKIWNLLEENNPSTFSSIDTNLDY